MKSLFIAGNWKSNKTITQSITWIGNYKSQISNFKSEHSTIVVCAPYISLWALKNEISKTQLSLQVGAQDVSPFGQGAYTGEVTALMIKEVADWVIIGHSERRKYFGETEEILQKKLEQSKSAGLKVIYCVQDENTPVPSGVDVVAYEPVWAIGTGKTDTPQNANSVVAAIKEKTNVKVVIYGGSVTEENVLSFVSQPSIDGVLPGGASLDPETFAHLILASQAAS